VNSYEDFQKEAKHVRIPHQASVALLTLAKCYNRKNHYSQRKSEAHEGLSLIAARYCIPIAIMMDNACEKTMGVFRKKPRDLGSHINQV